MRRDLVACIVMAIAACWSLSVFAEAGLAWPEHSRRQTSLQAQQQRPTVLSRLIWFDRSGTRLTGIGPVADHGNLELSPDGRRVAVAVAPRAGEPRDLWIYDTNTGARTQFTSEPSDENWLVWSADGRRVIGNSFGTERLALFEAPVDDGRTRTTLLADRDGKWPVSLSHDGRFLLYVTNTRETSNDIWVLPLHRRGRPYPFLRSEASENWASFSPDGKWIAFSSTEGGRAEVYVAAFPPNGRHWRVSVDGGSQSRWRRDGKEIFYVAPDRTLMAVSIATTKREFAVQEHRPLFRLDYPYGAYHAFDVTADGQRFLVNTVIVNPASSIVARASHKN